jgi:hypothetical protein
MTLQELLPTIRELSAAEKWELRALLDVELKAPDEQTESDEFETDGARIVAMFERRFGHLEPFELDIAPREPIRVDETLFDEFEAE